LLVCIGRDSYARGYQLAAAESADVHHITIAGLDVGGIIAFAAARDHGARTAAAVG
jgi:hypothetical protein